MKYSIGHRYEEKAFGAFPGRLQPLASDDVGMILRKLERLRRRDVAVSVPR